MLTADNMMRNMLDWIPPTTNSSEKEKALKERQKNFKYTPKTDPAPGTRLLPCGNGRACERGSERSAKKLTFTEHAGAQPGRGPDSGVAWWVADTEL